MEENKKFVFTEDMKNLCNKLIFQSRYFLDCCFSSCSCESCILGFGDYHFQSCCSMYLAHYLVTNGYIKNKE